MSNAPPQECLLALLEPSRLHHIIRPCTRTSHLSNITTAHFHILGVPDDLPCTSLSASTWELPSEVGKAPASFLQDLITHVLNRTLFDGRHTPQPLGGSIMILAKSHAVCYWGSSQITRVGKSQHRWPAHVGRDKKPTGAAARRAYKRSVVAR